jgi:hypothetical protein
MLGLFGTLDVAARSLSVQQEEMALAGQNVSNANNTAYADEQLEVSEATPVDTPFGEEGTGAQITGITDTRDALLDSQIQAEASTSGSLSAQQTNLQNAEAYLDEQVTSSSSSTADDSPNAFPTIRAIFPCARPRCKARNRWPRNSTRSPPSFPPCRPISTRPSKTTSPAATRTSAPLLP